MKVNFFILGVGAFLGLAGCASHQGGAGAPLEYGTNGDVGEGTPIPIASPTFRPGMNPEDPRDPHFTTRPQPSESPPLTPP